MINGAGKHGPSRVPSAAASCLPRGATSVPRRDTLQPRCDRPRRQGSGGDQWSGMGLGLGLQSDGVGAVFEVGRRGRPRSTLARILLRYQSATTAINWFAISPATSPVSISSSSRLVLAPCVCGCVPVCMSVIAEDAAVVTAL